MVTISLASAAVTWTGSHLVRAGADATWLAAIITQLAQAPGLRDRLVVVYLDSFGADMG